MSLLAAAPARSASLLIWNGEVDAEALARWEKRASGSGDWSVTVNGPESPPLREAAASGKIPRALLRPRNPTDFTMLARLMGHDWALLPGESATLVSTGSLQSAILPLSEDPEQDRRTLRETIERMRSGTPTAGQLDSLAARWLAFQRVDDAIETLQRAQAMEAGRPSTLLLLADAHRLKGDLPDAWRYLRLAERARPNDPRLLRAEGEIALASGETQKALDCLERSLTADPSATVIRRMIGEILLGLGRYRLAEESFLMAGREPGTAARLASLSARRNDWDAALRHASRALEEDPEDWETRFLFARARGAEGELVEAILFRARTLIDAADPGSSAPPLRLPLLLSAVRDQIADLINATREIQRAALSGAARVVTSEPSPAIAREPSAVPDETNAAGASRDRRAATPAATRSPLTRDPLYGAVQESILAVDRLRSALPGRSDWDADRVATKRVQLALTLWSQGAYDLMKAMEREDGPGMKEAGSLLHDALRHLDETRLSSLTASGRPDSR